MNNSVHKVDINGGIILSDNLSKITLPTLLFFTSNFSPDSPLHPNHLTSIQTITLAFFEIFVMILRTCGCISASILE